jgi:hypothetical protein
LAPHYSHVIIAFSTGYRKRDIVDFHHLLAPAATRADIPAMPPIALTDSQLAAVMAAAQPLPPDDRSPFLAEVAALLQGQTIGDGSVSRATADAWAKFWDPPQLDRAKGKWR